MDSVRERLISSLCEFSIKQNWLLAVANLAKFLIANGVTIPVRCKDCKYWCDSWVAPDGKQEHGYCHLEDADDVIVGRWGDDFCSYGERRAE